MIQRSAPGCVVGVDSAAVVGRPGLLAKVDGASVERGLRVGVPHVELDLGDASGAGEAVDCVAGVVVVVVGGADGARLLAHLQALRRAEVRGDVAGGERAAVVGDGGHLGFGRIVALEIEALSL